MKDTYIPLDIAFIDDDGTILQIAEMYPLSTRTVDSEHYCRMALEVNHGWFKKNAIKVGDTILGEGIDVRYANTIREAKIDKFRGKKNTPKENLEQRLKEKSKDKPKDKPKDRPKGMIRDVPPLELTPQAPNEEAEEPMDTLAPEGMPPSPDTEEAPEQVPPDVKTIMNTREKVKYADQNKLPMEIMYISESGKSLPPRKIYPTQREGYLIKNGPNGEYFIGLDVSPTIRGKGYDIPGNTIKNWLFSGIQSLEILEGDLSQKPKTPKTNPKVNPNEKAKGKNPNLKKDING